MGPGGDGPDVAFVFEIRRFQCARIIFLGISLIRFEQTGSNHKEEFEIRDVKRCKCQ